MKTSKPKSVSSSKKTPSVKKTARAKPAYVEPLITDTLKDIMMKQSNTTKKVTKLKIGQHAISTDSKSTKRLSVKKQNKNHLVQKHSNKKQKKVLFNAQTTFQPAKTWNPEQVVNSSHKKQKISFYEQANKSLSRVQEMCEQATNSILRTKRKSDANILQQASTMYQMLNKRLNELQQNQAKFQETNNTRIQKYEQEKKQQLGCLKQQTVALKSFLEEGNKKNQILEKKYISLQKNLEIVRNELGNKENIIRELTQSNRKLRESNVSVTSRFPIFQQQIEELQGNLTKLNTKKLQLEENILRNQKQKAFIKEQSKFILKNLRQYQKQDMQLPDMTQQSQNQNFYA